jgi:hypothetical protein
LLMKKIGHRVDEYRPWAFPLKREGQTIRPKA